MVNPVTPNLYLEVPLRGAEVGTWDTPMNSNFTIIDSAFGAVTSVAVSSTTVVLAASQAQASILRFSGTLADNVFVIIPSTIIRKFWIAENLTTNSTVFSVKLINSTGGNYIALPPGEPVDVFSDGTNFYFRNLGRVGSYLDLSVNAVPAWISGCSVFPYLNCDGGSFSSAVYPYLTSFLGGTILPDSRGRVRMVTNQGTSRVTTASGAVDGNTLLAAGGVPTITLGASQIPTLTGTGTATTGVFNYAVVTGGTYAFAAGGISNPTVIDGGTNQINSTVTVNSSIGGNPHNIVQPTYVGGITLIRAL